MASSVLARLAVLISGDTAGLNKGLGQSTKALNTFQKSANAVGTSLAGIAAGVSFVALGKEIINITSEFQKFEAVLTNTLGSNSEAQKALEQIREFAAKTPFSVQELTSSFVKLANQGFEPTRDEMRKLGDLASSTGKSFDQLTEAIIDAQVGEFERLKEFGVRAQKAGDQVKFTFKGVQTQTEFTADSIRDYLLSLGDLEGVSGSMAAISGTLGGKISNLGDSFDNLLLTIGSLTSGPLATFVDLLNESLASITDILTDDKIFTRADAINKEYVESATNIDQINTNLEKLQRLQKIETQAYDEVTAKLGDLNTQLKLTPEQYFKLGKEQQTAKEFAEAYGQAIEALTVKMVDLNKATETQAVALIPGLNAQIKHFEELKNQAFSEEAIGRFNVKIQELRNELEVLNATGFQSGFLKNLEKGIVTPSPSEATAPEGLFPTTVPAPDIAPYIDAINQMDAANELFNQNQEIRAANDRARFDAQIANQVAAADAAVQFGDAVGESLGQALSGQITFAQAMKKITADIAKTMLARAMAGIIASAATSGGPPPVALALAAAGVAAIGALFSKFVGTTGGGGAGTGGIGARATQNVTRIGRSDRPEDRIEFDAKFEIEGTKLVAVTNNTNTRKQRTG